MATIPVTLPREELEQFCRRNHIRKLSLFGSVLTDRFRPESDIDVLVEALRPNPPAERPLQFQPGLRAAPLTAEIAFRLSEIPRYSFDCRRVPGSCLRELITWNLTQRRRRYGAALKGENRIGLSKSKLRKSDKTGSA